LPAFSRPGYAAPVTSPDTQLLAPGTLGAVARHEAALARHREAVVRHQALVDEWLAGWTERQRQRAEREEARVARGAARAADLEARAAREAAARDRAALREEVTRFVRRLKAGGAPPERALVTVKGLVADVTRSATPALREVGALTAEVVRWSIDAYCAVDAGASP
jgi:hypothetical protein